MATLQQRNGSYRVLFVYHGKRETFTLGKVSQEEAEAKAAQVDYLLLRLKQRLAAVPPGISIVEYVTFDGKPVTTDTPGKVTLAILRDRYLATHEPSLEATTLGGMRVHFRHLVKHFGQAFPIADLSLADLQQYVDRRAKAKGMNGRKLSPATIKKEVVTLRTAWNWGAKMKLVSGRFPYHGTLRYRKSDEKPPFMTSQQIEQLIAAGGLTKAEEADLWDALYLKVNEISELLDYIKTTAAHPFIHPLCCFAAHTGARRSEIIRTRITDLKFSGKVVTIRERQRVKGRGTTRRVPLSPFLIGVLKKWLAIHPGGQYLFCHTAVVERTATSEAE